MSDEERAKKCLIRGQQRFHCNYREHPEKLLGDIQAEEIAAEFATVRREERERCTEAVKACMPRFGPEGPGTQAEQAYSEAIYDAFMAVQEQSDD